MFIVVAALLILAEVWRAWQNPAPLVELWTGLAVNGVAAAINAFWASLLIRVGRSERSPAMVADGRHIMTDVVTSAGVIAGLAGVILTGWTILDPLLAVIVALNILWQGWQVIVNSVDGLMDRAVDRDEHLRIRDIISANAKGALEVHDLKTRIAGRATFIEFHLVVDAGMTVGESHVICDRIEEALRREIPSVRITIHVEPDDEAKLPPGTAAVPFAEPPPPPGRAAAEAGQILTSIAVRYMKPTPQTRPAIAAGENSAPAEVRPRRNRAVTSTMTCRIAPAPIASASADHCGAKARLPIHRPTTAGPPASSVSATKVQSGGRSLRIGAAMPMPSVMLWSVKPSTRKVPSPAAPAANAAPMASPSPRLCRPMPSAM